MKKFLIGLVIITLCNSVFAATKCVQSPTNCWYGGHDHNTPNWEVYCTPYNLQGIGMCSTTAGTTGSAASKIYHSSDSTKNTICWCKMTYPIVSKYIFRADYGSYSSCTYYCSADCQALIGQNHSSLTKDMFFSNIEK